MRVPNNEPRPHLQPMSVEARPSSQSLDLIETKSIVAPFFLLYSTAVPSEHLYLPSYLSLLISIVLVTLVMRLVFIFWWLLWFVSGSTCLNVVVLQQNT